MPAWLVSSRKKPALHSGNSNSACSHGIALVPSRHFVAASRFRKPVGLTSARLRNPSGISVTARARNPSRENRSIRIFALPRSVGQRGRHLGCHPRQETDTGVDNADAVATVSLSNTNYFSPSHKSPMASRAFMSAIFHFAISPTSSASAFRFW